MAWALHRDRQGVVPGASRNHHFVATVRRDDLVVVHSLSIEYYGRRVGPSRQRVPDNYIVRAYALRRDVRAVGVSGVSRGHVGRSATQLDRLTRNRGLTLRNLRNECHKAVTEIRIYTEPLVHDRPRGAVIAPCLHEHRAACPAAVDVGTLVRRREDLRHCARLLVRRPAGRGLTEHRLGQRVGVALLLARTQAAVVALADRLDRGRQAEDDLLTRAV